MIELNFPNAVSREEDFYGRKTERERIEQTLLTGNPRSIIILGERRIGKTSLQNVSARRMQSLESGRFVPLCLNAPAIRSLEDYAREILHGICSYLGASLGDTGLLDPNGQFKLRSLGEFTDATARLLQIVSDKTLILCIDELDSILVNCQADADKIRGLTDYVIQSPELPLLVFVSMAHLPQSMRKAFASPVLTSESEVIELGPLSEGETVEMVRGLLEDQVRLGEGAVERLLRLSAGHPYFVKLLLDHLLARYWRGAQLAVSPDMIEAVIPDAAHDPRVRYALDNIYKMHFNQQERQLVLLLAERGTLVAEDELRALGPDLITAARRLERRGYLAREGDGYDFRVHFLGHWLRQWEEYEEELEYLMPYTKAHHAVSTLPPN